MPLRCLAPCLKFQSGIFKGGSNGRWLAVSDVLEVRTLWCSGYIIAPKGRSCFPIECAPQAATHRTDCSLRQGARPLKGTYKGDLFTYLLRFFGYIWAHQGPYGPIWARMGPARALEEREKFRTKKSRFWHPDSVFGWKKPCSSGFWPKYVWERF